MYEFVTDTWNTIKGKCFHDCSYCYMKRWGEQKPVRFDTSELDTNLMEGDFIFVGSSCDMFNANIPISWIENTLFHCKKHKTKYLFQTKNPERYHGFTFPENFILGTTIETNKWFQQMGNTPYPLDRARAMKGIPNKKFLTIEPIMDFDLEQMIDIINTVNPKWVNIGADTGNNHLPEPTKEKIELLIKSIDSKITIKKNMKRISRLFE